MDEVIEDLRDASFEVKQRAYPSAIRVKETILNGRDAAIDAQVACVELLRKWHGREYYAERELGHFQSCIIKLYLLLRPKFPKKDSIHELTKVIIENKKLDLKALNGYLNILIDKIEDLGITRIEKAMLGRGSAYLDVG